MLHGFGNPEDCGESRTQFWSLCCELLRATNPATPSPGLLGVDPVRGGALRAVIGKLLDSEDHTIDTPVEREVLELLMQSAFEYAQAALEQLADFRKIISRAEGMKLAAGVPPGSPLR